MYTFLRSPRWIIGSLVAIFVALACVRLGFWQLDRMDQRRAYNLLVSSRMQERPVLLTELLASAGEGEGEGADPAALAYRRVIATGSYDLDAEFLLFGRPLDEQPGNHVFTPLVLQATDEDEGMSGERQAVIVRRGWVPFELDTPPVPEATPPEGDVTVSGVLMPTDTGDARPLLEEDGTLVRVSQVNISQIDAALSRRSDATLVPLSLWLLAQDPPPGDLPRLAPLPMLEEGPHLSYAVQWFIFAAIALGGWLILIRREAKGRPPDERETE